MLARDAAKRDRAREMRRNGSLKPEIARALEISERKVMEWCKDIPAPVDYWKRGVEAAKAARDEKHVGLRKLASAMRAEGWTCDQVARKLRLTRQTVSLWTCKPRVVVPLELRKWNRKMQRAGLPAMERRRLIADALQSGASV